MKYGEKRKILWSRNVERIRDFSFTRGFLRANRVLTKRGDAMIVPKKYCFKHFKREHSARVQLDFKTVFALLKPTVCQDCCF